MIDIDDDITRARTPPANFYRNPALYERSKARVFASSWQLVGDAARAAGAGDVEPVTLLPGMLDEPLLLARDGERLRVLSNVCTHRGTILCEAAGRGLPSLTCRYHGRKFGLDGRCKSMPEFEQMVGFPGESDHLKAAASATLGERLLFASLAPSVAFDALIAPVAARLGALPFHEARFDAARTRTYDVKANWMLYVDNYLEGFHIPFVHGSLNAVLDFGEYTTELFPGGSLQIGIGKSEADCFAGTKVAGYYLWLFPNTMLNFYPWGISANVVEPVAIDRSRVVYLTWVWDEARLETGAGAGLERVEHEDEAVVEAVQRGLAGRLYDRGRYSPTREQGVHHFHRLLSFALVDGDG
jgi:choline monooxygenase